MGREHRTDHGENDLLSRIDIDLCSAWCTLAAQQVKGEIARAEVGNTQCVSYRVQLPCLVSLEALLRIDAHIVGGRDMRRRGKEFPRKDAAGHRQTLFGVVGYARSNRCERRTRHGNRQAIECLLRDRLRWIAIDRDGNLE